MMSLLCISVISITSALVMMQFLTEHLLSRDAIVTMEYIQSVAEAEEQELSFREPEKLVNPEGLAELFVHISNIPNVFRANVYSTERKVVWSTQPELLDKYFENNHELERALLGMPVYELSQQTESQKAEHVYIPADVTTFVENYLPIWNVRHTEVVGVVEVYKYPRALFATLDQAKRMVWMLAIGSGVFIYCALFLIVRRASLVMDDQQQRLLESEKMASMGEMASVVAHSIRNPLAAIRSSAELALEEQLSAVAEMSAKDITMEVDRVELWVKELLLFSSPARMETEPVELTQLVRDNVQGLARRMERLGVVAIIESAQTLPKIRGDTLLLNQILNSLISNALEAMPDGGTLTIGTQAVDGGKSLKFTIADTGQGIARDKIKDVFKPFVTGKRTGLGIGLTLVRHIIMRHGGKVWLQSEIGRGTCVTFKLPAEV
jgi:signal transduction histidine kinase